MAALAPGLVLRLGINFLKAKRRVKKSGKSFERELLRNGVPAREARKLVEDYVSVMSIRFWTRNLGEMGIPFLAGRIRR